MPQYLWDPSTQRFRDGAGRFVTGGDLEYAFRRVQERLRSYLETIAGQVVDGSISLSRFQSLAGAAIKEGHVLAVTAAWGGKAQMGPEQRGRAGQIVRTQYEALRTFAAEVEAGVWPLTRVRQRAALYAASMWSTYQSQRTESAKDAGLTEERSILASMDRACVSCNEEADKEWQPIGTIKPIGQRECKMNCRCDMEYR